MALGSDGMPNLDSQRCTNCGDCTAVCFPDALIIYGKEMTVLEVFEEVQRDEIFYESSGGVTVSGGEPLQQASFVQALFELCREAGIHTALETCGFASRKALEQVLQLTDYVIFDLKHLDSQTHQIYTGKPNTRILENAKIVARSGLPVLFRAPLIPGVNDSLENIRETACFIKKLQGDEAAFELLPYHRLGKAKSEALHRSYLLEELRPSEPDYVESIRQSYEDMGINCTISK